VSLLLCFDNLAPAGAGLQRFNAAAIIENMSAALELRNPSYCGFRRPHIWIEWEEENLQVMRESMPLSLSQPVKIDTPRWASTLTMRTGAVRLRASPITYPGSCSRFD
jgi:hypothetical protein